VAAQQLPAQMSMPSPAGAGALVSPFSTGFLARTGNLAVPPPVERFGGAQGPGLEDRMENLRDIFGAALGHDQSARPVRQMLADAVQAAMDRRASNAAAISPAIAPAARPADQPGVIDVVGSPAPVEGATAPAPVGQDSVPSDAEVSTSNAEVFGDELSKSKADRPVQETIKNELEKSKADRPIAETVKDDLTMSKEDRPIEQRLLESLIAGKDELKLSEDVQEKLLETVADESGIIDPGRKKELLADAEAKLKERYQLIIDNFVAKMGKSPSPQPAGGTA